MVLLAFGVQRAANVAGGGQRVALSDSLATSCFRFSYPTPFPAGSLRNSPEA